MKKLICFNPSKETVILEYRQDDNKEIIAFIEPYTFCTYLVDFNVIHDRDKTYPSGVKVWLTPYTSLTWNEFLIMAVREKLFTDELLECIVERHSETESIKHAFHCVGNHNFSFN